MNSKISFGKHLALVFVVLMAFSALFVACSNDSDSSGGGSASYAFQGKTYWGYISNHYGFVRFDKSGNGAFTQSDVMDGMSGTYTVSGDFIMVTWSNGQKTSFLYDSSKDCIYYGNDKLTNQ